MPEGLLLAAALCSGVIGLAWLALTLDSHWQQVRGKQPLPPAAVKSLRFVGVGALAASLAFCLLADHPSMAALVWVMDLAVSALIVAFTFTWWPRAFAPLIAWVRSD